MAQSSPENPPSSGFFVAFRFSSCAALDGMILAR